MLKIQHISSDREKHPMHLSKPDAGAILGHEAIDLYAYRDPVDIWTELRRFV
jgi:hypothetical protein